MNIQDKPIFKSGFYRQEVRYKRLVPDERIPFIRILIKVNGVPAEEVYSQGNEEYDWEYFVDNCMFDMTLDRGEINKLLTSIAKTYPEQFVKTLEEYMKWKNDELKSALSKPEVEYNPYFDEYDSYDEMNYVDWH